MCWFWTRVRYDTVVPADGTLAHEKVVGTSASVVLCVQPVTKLSQPLGAMVARRETHSG